MNFTENTLAARLKGKSIFFATPCYGAVACLNYQTSMQATTHLLRSLGVDWKYPPSGGDSLVPRARNNIVARFLESYCTHMMHIDADIGWEAVNVVKMLAGDVDIVGAIYPKKCYPIEWPANPFHDEPFIRHEDTGWLAWKHLPTGFLLIKREVITSMVAKHPEWKTKFDPTNDEEPNGYALFDCFDSGHDTRTLLAQTRAKLLELAASPLKLQDAVSVHHDLNVIADEIKQPEDPVYLSEDFAFCERAHADGYITWCGPTIALSLFGVHLFRGGCYADAVFKQPEEKIEGWMSPDELRWLKSAATDMDSIIEIGSWKGRSTHALLSKCKGPVYAVDTWQGSPEDIETHHAEAKQGGILDQFIANVGHFANLNVCEANSQDTGLLESLPEVDMVFIDGSHEYEAVKADIDAYKGKARKLICGHDSDRPSVQRAVAEVFGKKASIAAGSIWQVWL